MLVTLYSCTNSLSPVEIGHGGTSRMSGIRNAMNGRFSME